jgi:REP element-mobilizing transposase RayT
MPSYLKVWIHFVWAVKNREKLISRELKQKLYEHIKMNAKAKNIYVDHLNGTENHIHVLVSLKGEQCISKIAFLLKGESSHWINKNKFIEKKFEWQNEFIAISVSESLLPRVRAYIRNQEKHHKLKSFSEEYDQFISRYAFSKFLAKDD